MTLLVFFRDRLRRDIAQHTQARTQVGCGDACFMFTFAQTQTVAVFANKSTAQFLNANTSNKKMKTRTLCIFDPLPHQLLDAVRSLEQRLEVLQVQLISLFHALGSTPVTQLLLFGFCFFYFRATLGLRRVPTHKPLVGAALFASLLFVNVMALTSLRLLLQVRGRRCAPVWTPHSTALNKPKCR